MLYKINKKQNNTGMCFICGLNNPYGLKMRFYESGDLLIGKFSGKTEHQSYPERMHGGIISTVLDETLGRALGIKHPELWGVTTEITVKFRKPVALNEQLYCVSKLPDKSNLFFKSEGKIIDANGTVYAEAVGKYMIIPITKIAGKELDHANWFYEEEDINSLEFLLNI